MNSVPVLTQLDCRTIDKETMGHCYSEIPPLGRIPKPIVSSSHKERQDSNCHGINIFQLRSNRSHARASRQTSSHLRLCEWVGVGGGSGTTVSEVECVREILLVMVGVTARALDVSASHFLLYLGEVEGEAETVTTLPSPGPEGRGMGDAPRIR